MIHSTVRYLEGLIRRDFDNTKSRIEQIGIIHSAVDSLGEDNPAVIEMISDYEFEHKTKFGEL